uniref:EF-hand domain-containing protein n=1 Tax=Vitis vinifera TaxID=29760 RepID=F6H4X7_VITVI
MGKKHALLLLQLLLLLQVNPGNCRYIAPKYSSSGQVSNGGGEVQQPAFVVFEHRPSPYSCKQTHGVMPCTTTVFGNVFLILVYGYLMFFAARLLYDGSEILVELLSPGITGGVFLPLLSSLPDAIIILASRLCGNKDTASSQVSAGSALLGGSTAMLLTLLGGCCIIVGKCDLENLRAKPVEKNARGFSLVGSAASTDIRASYTARIMVISVMPFIIIQLSQVLHTTSQICLAVLISLIISISLLLAYCLHQVFHPSVLKTRLTHAKDKHMMSRIVKHLKCCTLGRLLTANGEPDREVIKKLFEMIGEDSDQQLSASELRALITGIQIKEDSDIDEAVGKVLTDFDACGDSKINLDAFIIGISKWYDKAKHSAVCSSDSDFQTRIIIDDFNTPTSKGNELLGIQFYTAEKIENPKWSAFKGVFILLLGTLIAATFVDPLVNAVGNFYSATNIPPFFVSFIVLPFASSSEAVSALIFASQKKLRIAPLTVSEIYGAVNMNNLLCLSVFLGLLYFRHLTWNFTSEVLIILIIWTMLLLMMVSPRSCGRVAANNSSSSGLVSDGDGEVQQPAFIVFEEWASSYSCNQTYGFMPCTATVPGNILLILVYVSLMLFAAKLLYDGSEILVELLSPGIAGAVFLPLLSSLLDAIINIASRLCGNGETAQNQVSAGLGLLTGSTAILLTLLGGCCIIVDKCDPENSREKASEETARGFSLAGSAISTDIRASYTARIMVISVMPFIIVQLAQVLHTSSQICFAIFISLIISVSLLLAYCLHQVFHPSILRRKLAYAKQMHMTSRIVKQLKYSPLERLLTTNGEPDMEVIRMLVFVLVSTSFPY